MKVVQVQLFKLPFESDEQEEELRGLKKCD